MFRGSRGTTETVKTIWLLRLSKVHQMFSGSRGSWNCNVLHSPLTLWLSLVDLWDWTWEQFIHVCSRTEAHHMIKYKFYLAQLIHSVIPQDKLAMFSPGRQQACGTQDVHVHMHVCWDCFFPESYWQNFSTLHNQSHRLEMFIFSSFSCIHVQA